MVGIFLLQSSAAANGGDGVPGERSDYAVGSEVVFLLKGYNRLPCRVAEYAVY